MKKLAFLAFLATSLLSGSDYKYEITPVLGYTFPNHDQELRDHTVTGVQLQFNEVNTPIKPELLFLYSDTDRRDDRDDVDISRLVLHGVYEFHHINRLTPFMKGGIGYEIMSDHYLDNHNSPFADAGAGLKIGLTDQISLKIEALEMLKYNKANWDLNLLYMLGLNYAFGQKTITEKSSE
ncbi:outer membrane protein [Sulfuricurvum sp.]|uniref:outer membrane protein n=1 Tax=Sulfuricurvum sp. TaxID=2025608 RepID=UPI003561B31B